MADAFGLNDFSMLTGPQQDTARTIQKAFDASTAGRARMLDRFNLSTQGPMLTQFANDAALQRAQVTAGLLNNNQQLQNVIDASHRTPHGLAENLSAYLPALGGLARLYPALFGTNTALGKEGLLGAGWKGLQSMFGGSSAAGQSNPIYQFKDAKGNIYGLNDRGEVVTWGMQDRGVGQDMFGNAAGTNMFPYGDMSMPQYDFNSMFPYGDMNMPQQVDFSGFSDWWG